MLPALGLGLNAPPSAPARPAPGPEGYAGPMPQEQPKDFINRYLEAHNSGNVLAALGLVHLEGTPDFLKRMHVENFEGDFRFAVKKVEFLPPSEDMITRFEMDGASYVMNLEPYAQMHLTFVQKDPANPHTGVVYPIGVHDGKFKIISARPLE